VAWRAINDTVYGTWEVVGTLTLTGSDSNSSVIANFSTFSDDTMRCNITQALPGTCDILGSPSPCD
jgi:hypothetical protein